LHTAQLMPLPLTVSCFSEIQIGFTFLVLAHPGSPGQRAVKRVSRCECRMPLSCSVAISFLLFSHHTRPRPLAFWQVSFVGLKFCLMIFQGIQLFLCTILHTTLLLCFGEQDGCEWVCVLWYWPTQVVSDSGPLNGCVCVYYKFRLASHHEATSLCAAV